jgi:uncharacterized membrane protein
MLRGNHAIEMRLAGEPDFRWRGEGVTRLEGFSDAVFAFAVTLLVVSLEVPKTYGELMNAMRGFAVFGVCFALLVDVWFNHYRYFRRYGLQDSWAVFLNCVLLFFVVFYVYPLKFLFVMLFNGGASIDAEQARTLLMIYGLGYAAVFLIFALLYRHAWGMRGAFDLNEVELLKTRQSMVDHVAMVIVGLVSAILAFSLPANLVGIAGYFYFVIGIYYSVSGTFFAKRYRLLAQESNKELPPADSTE